jgi:hypothetical protein
MDMSIWTNHPCRADADGADSLAYGPSGGPLKRWLAGVGVALLPIVYGIHCLWTGHAVLPGRHRVSLETSGSTATALAIAYLALGAFIHFHYFWGLHRRLYGWSELLKVLAVLALLGSLGYAAYHIML